MSRADFQSIALLTASVLYAVTATQKRWPLQRAATFCLAGAGLLIIAWATASLAMSGRLTTPFFVVLTGCALVVGAALYFRAWRRWAQEK